MLLAVSPGFSNKIECFTFGKIINLELVNAEDIFLLCFGEHPKSFSPVMTNDGCFISFNQEIISVSA